MKPTEHHLDSDATPAANAQGSDVEHLQAEIDDLRERNAALEADRHRSIASRLGGIGRSIGVILLVLLGVICLIISPPTIWGRNLLLNTDRYVETVKPLASDPGVQQAVITAVDNHVTSNIDVPALVRDTLPPRAAVLGPPLQNAVNGLVNRVTTRFVESPAFERIWVNANRIAHTQINYILTGKRPTNGVLKVSNTGTVSVDVSAVVARVKQRLVSAGLTVANKIPNAGPTVQIANLKKLQQARNATKAFNTLANWLPWIGLALIAGGIAAARKHRRTLMIAAGAVAVGMAVLGIGIMVVRHLYLNAIPTDKLPESTAQSIFDTIVRFLRDGLRLVALVALIILLIALLAGPSAPARAVRRWLARFPHWVNERWQTRTWPSERVSNYVQRYRNQLRAAIIGLLLIILVLWDNPGLAVIITLAVIAVLLLLVVEALRAGAAKQVTNV